MNVIWSRSNVEPQAAELLLDLVNLNAFFLARRKTAGWPDA
jgi:hypothetical protein